MIVVDETISARRVLAAIVKWYPGAVISVKEFRPHARIFDSEIPGYLLQLRQPTFVTINYADFAPHLCLHRRYCVVRLKLPQEKALFVPELLRAVLRDQRFNTKAKRMGKVISWMLTSLSFVEV